jgi:hypothetical protein
MSRRAILFRLKEGKAKQWMQWCSQLEHDLKVEAIETLREESISEELCMLVRVDGAPYVLGFVAGDSLPANLSRELNTKHQQMKEECLEYENTPDVLYHLEV